MRGCERRRGVLRGADGAPDESPDHRAALGWFEKSLKIFPRETTSLEAAKCAVKLEQWAKARDLADRTTREFPKGNPAVIDEAKRLLPTVLKELAKQK